MDDEQQPAYRFKLTNVDLDVYLHGMRSRAGELRCKARMLDAQASMIDEERARLAVELVLANQ